MCFCAGDSGKMSAGLCVICDGDCPFDKHRKRIRAQTLHLLNSTCTISDFLSDFFCCPIQPDKYKHVCHDCRGEIVTIHRLQSKCRQAEDKLRNKLNISSYLAQLRRKRSLSLTAAAEGPITPAKQPCLATSTPLQPVVQLPGEEFMMEGGDHCAVFGCNNDRRYPERYVIKEHVATLRFHSCRNKKDYPLWTKLLQRKDFKVTKSTKVCSNHFVYGGPFPIDPDPSLFLKGYDVSDTPEQSQVNQQRSSLPVPAGTDSSSVHVKLGSEVEHDHDYTQTPALKRGYSLEYVTELHDKIDQLRKGYDDARTKMEKLERELRESQSKANPLSADNIRFSDELDITVLCGPFPVT